MPTLLFNLRVLLPLMLVLLASCSGGSAGGVADAGSTTPNGGGGSGDVVMPAPTPSPAEPVDFLNFETVPTRSMAQVGNVLYVINARDNRVEGFALDGNGQLRASEPILVGLEPIAIAARNEQELWVVNHLSDSISIIDLSVAPARVVKTLLVGDEPRDIVFAQDRAFVTTAHRGQHRVHASLDGVPGAGDPRSHQAGLGRADVWVFDAANTGNALGGRPLKIIELFGDTPRGLAVSPDQSIVYAAVFHSGNQTSIVHEGVMCPGFTDDQPGAPYSGQEACAVKDGISSPNGPGDGQLPGGRPAPGTNIDGVAQPWTSMIVKYDQGSGQWRDSLGRNFSNAVRFTLSDQDVFAISATSLEPQQSFRHVGTTLFNMAVNPASGRLYVSNTSSQNHVRFEGPGQHGGSTVQGNLARARISVLDPAGASVETRALNAHIDYSQLKASDEVRQRSVATPLDIKISSDGDTAFVAALGSDKVAVYKTDLLDSEQAWRAQDAEQLSEQHIDVAGGPVGLHLNETKERLYVLTHIDHSVVVLDLATGQELQRISLFNPEPAEVTAGRFMLYDAKRTSSNGEASCASCHVFADMDHLAWNLGNPDASNTENPNPQPTRNLTTLACDLIGPDDPFCSFLEVVNGDGNLDSFASMKGPMMTQTLRGVSTHGHMHWRGDRANGYFGKDTEQNLDERLSIKNFIVAYEGLLGLDVNLPDSVNANVKSSDVLALEQDMDRFADFILSLQMPPNPHQSLNGEHSPSAQIGRDFFLGGRRSDGIAEDTEANGAEEDGVNCAGCHVLDPGEGFFGTDGAVAHGGEIQMLKVPQLRNLYQRVGMFGLPDREGFLVSTTREHQGEQIRGFGFLHDGATDRLFNFLQGAVFDNGEEGCPPGMDSSHGCDVSIGRIGIPDDTVRLGLVDYLLEFDTDLAAVVGQQITLNARTDSAATHSRIALLEERAAAEFTSAILGGVVTECDLTANGVINSVPSAFLFDTIAQQYAPDAADDALLSTGQLRALAVESGNSVTFTCVPPGSGRRIALDRDRDGVLNRD